MKIAVIGAGVVGLATAYELASAGADVTLMDRRGAAAEDASFATGALLHPGWALAWGNPAPRLQSPWSEPASGLRWRLGADAQGWLWWRRWRKAARRRGEDAGTALAHMLTDGVARQAELTAALDLDHDRSDGMLILLSSADEQRRAGQAVEHLKALGLAARLISDEDARKREPALDGTTALAGAVALDGPAAANCREWTLLMRQRLLALGGRHLPRTEVTAISPSGGGVSLYTANAATLECDAAVLCTGAEDAGLMAGLGLAAPWRTWWSCSLSAPVREPIDAPVSAVLDPATGIAITRLGQRVRVSGGWDLGGPSGAARAETVRHLARGLTRWFAGAVRMGGAQAAWQPWRGAVCQSPDGLPVIGASRVPGVWLNLAHGPIGWALASGAARHLVEAMGSDAGTRTPHPFDPSRLGL